MSRSTKNSYRILFFLLLGIGIALSHRLYHERIPFTIERAALWVPRFDYSTPEDVKQIIKNASSIGFTDVFFQVRGNGTVFYPSDLEPWAHDLHGGDLEKLGKNPGWNPLQLAAEQAAYHNINFMHISTYFLAGRVALIRQQVVINLGLIIQIGL